MANTYKKIKKILVKKFDVDPSKLGLDNPFRRIITKNFGNFMFLVEEKFYIIISCCDWEGLTTIRRLVEYLDNEECIRGKSSKLLYIVIYKCYIPIGLLVLIMTLMYMFMEGLRVALTVLSLMLLLFVTFLNIQDAYKSNKDE